MAVHVSFKACFQGFEDLFALFLRKGYVWHSFMLIKGWIGIIVRTSSSADRTAAVRIRTRGGRRSFGNQSSNDMPFPHPQSRKDHDRNEHIASRGSVVWN